MKTVDMLLVLLFFVGIQQTLFVGAPTPFVHLLERCYIVINYKYFVLGPLYASRFMTQ